MFDQFDDFQALVSSIGSGVDPSSGLGSIQLIRLTVAIGATVAIAAGIATS